MLVRPKSKRSNAEFEKYPIYEGNDLGVTYSPEGTRVKFWSPLAEKVEFRLYPTGHDSEADECFDMILKEDGVWELYIKGDIRKSYYTFRVKYDGEWLDESPDMYAKAIGVNGERGMVIDLKRTDPEGWGAVERPHLDSFTDIILYELHVRDFTIADSSGVNQKGKYLGLTEEGTVSPQREKTGLDHLKELGITHVHLLPIYDFLTVDESDPDKEQYNWGYDPQNYNALEGWYATDPFNGKVRIIEFKKMVQKLHLSGLRVVMDVVYNHTGVTNESVFERTVPGYFYRFAPNGHFSNASGCGNEVASERAMVRKYIVESVVYWATEYKIDGFRFDLMGILDVETMNTIRKALDKVDPTIFIYGEGWTGGLSPYPEEKRAMKFNTVQLEGIASFSDDFRDAIKGHWSSEQERGFASGQEGYEESIKFGVAAASPHPQINYQWVNYSKHPWAKNPTQTINFVSCHDNHTLWDKLKLSAPDANYDQHLKMQKLALGIILTSQGVPFLHSGVEIGRTKDGEHNSYNLPDEINRLDWSLKSKNKGLFNYVKGLIELRREHPAFRIATTEGLAKHLSFLSTYGPNFLGFHLREYANGDRCKHIIVAYNGGHFPFTYSIPKGEWVVLADRTRVSLSGIDVVDGGEATVPGISIQVLVDKESFEKK